MSCVADASTDDRDGQLIITHSTLLLGCTAPLLYCMLCGISEPLPALSGVIALGLADSAVSVLELLRARHRD